MAGALESLGTVFPEYAIFLILVPVILAAICSTINSYREYLNEGKSKSLDPDLYGARLSSLPPAQHPENAALYPPGLTAMQAGFR